MRKKNKSKDRENENWKEARKRETYKYRKGGIKKDEKSTSK
jgi:hypothetical protein